MSFSCSTRRLHVRSQAPGSETTQSTAYGAVQARSSLFIGHIANSRSQWRDWMVSSTYSIVLCCCSSCHVHPSGKSTQVPAFILEDQLLKGRHCKIYCTEPRRISAISLAQRVSRELGEPAGVVGTGNSLVGYAIRLESNIIRRTRLAYVTNGIALRMLEGGSGQGGQGTAFDEITVRPFLLCGDDIIKHAYIAYHY